MSREKTVLKKTRTCGLFLILACIFVLVLAAYVTAANEPVATLLAPDDGKVFNVTNNINFSCNTTVNTTNDNDRTLRKLELYTSTNGTFLRTNTSCFGELCEDTSTMLLLHFNNDSLAGENDTLVYDWSGNGNNATVSGAAFNATGGNFSGTFELDGSGSQHMKISDSNSIDLSLNGTIEFRIYPKDISTDVYILTKAPADACTSSAYAILLTQGIIEMDFGSNNDEYTYVEDTLPVAANQWSHIVVTWNGSGVRIYVNNMSSGDYIQSNRNLGYGVRGAGNSYYAPSIITNNNDLWLGTPDPSCTPSISYYANRYYFNGKIDELALYNRALSAEEVNEHYGRTLISNATKNWTAVNISDGTYTWNCRAYDNRSQSAYASSNRTFYVDMTTPPAVNSVTASPNSTEELDPGVTINITANITDVSGVSTAILQYKNPNEGFFRNATMTYDGSSKLYDASFTPPLADSGIWKYRIWANDSRGNARTGNETNLSVEFDRTWQLAVINVSGLNASGFGTISAPNGTTVTIGTVIINNTGDNTLNFDLAYTPTSPDIQMSYNISEPFDVPAKSATSFNITAISPQQIYEWPIQLIINTSSLATPAGAIVSGTLVPFRGGPYLDVSIQSYQATVSHNQEFNLSAKAKNLGNETAADAWLNWTLPAGWDVTAGNKSEYLGNISNGSTGWNNITVIISATSATLGTFENGISITATSSENITKTDSKTVSAVCRNSDGVCGNGCTYTTDSDCSQPAASSGSSASGTTTSSGGGGGAVATYTPKYLMTISAPERIDAYRGKTAEFMVNISGAEAGTSVKDITLSIAGYTQVLISINPATIRTLRYGETRQFEANMDVPNYVGYGEYNLTITAKGMGRSSDTANAAAVQASRHLHFVVHSASENETISVIGNATAILESMSKLNIATEKASRLLLDAKTFLDGWDYDRAKEAAEMVIESGGTAIRSYDLLQQVNGMLEEAKKYGVDASQTSRMYALAKAAFDREDFDRAAQRANEALLTGSIETTGKVTVMRSLSQYSGEIIAAILLSACIGYVIYRRAEAERIAGKLKALQDEENSLEKLIAQTKRDYFELKAIGKAEYHKTMYAYETQAAKIKEARGKIMLKIIKMRNPRNAKEGLKKEEERVRKTMEEEQRKYFESGAVSKSSYRSTMHELREELAEIKMSVESANGMEKKNRAVLILAILCPALLLFSPFVFAADTASEGGSNSNENQAAAEQAITLAEGYLSEMQQAGLGTRQANDTLNEAKLLYSREDYAGAELLARYVETIKDTALKTGALIDNAETKIYDASAEGLGVADAQKLFASGIRANDAEDYVSAEKLLNQAINSVEDARAKAAVQSALEKSGGFGAYDSLKTQRSNILILLAASMVAAITLQKGIRKAKEKKRVRQIMQELDTANSIIKEIQKKYFGEGSISKSEYEAGMKKCREKILKAKRELAVLKNENNSTKKIAKSGS